jgi:hypothetical protein
MALPTITTFTPNTDILSAEVNANFTNLRNRDTVEAAGDVAITSTGGTVTITPSTFLKLGNKTKFHAYLNSAQSVNTGTDTKVQMGTELFDTGSNYDNATNYRFTAPIDGYYFFYAQLFAGNLALDKFWRCVIRVNGTTDIAKNQVVSQNSADDLTAVTTTLVYLTAGQYVEVYVNHDTGSARNVASGRESTYFFGYLHSV